MPISILASLTKDGFAGAIQVVRDGVETLDFAFCRGEYANRDRDLCLRVIVLDVKLPKIDGFEVLRELKADPRTRAIPVVMLTSSNIDSDVARAYELGANSYVQKPVDFDRFRRTVRDLGALLDDHERGRAGVAGRAAAREMTRDFAANGQLRILLLEDNEPDAYLVIHTMKTADPGAQIDRAATRRQFTELLASHDYDLVLADYRLPDWTGMDALREMRRLGFDMPLIIVTGTLGDESAVECVKSGAADYVLKQGTLARLPIAVKRAIEDKRARDESRHNQAMMEQAQQERREHEERFLQLADNIDELFFVIDAQHKETLYINPAYERIWGRSCQSLYDDPRSFVEAVSPEDRGRLLDYMARIERGEQAGKLEYRVVQPNGNVRWLLTHAVPIRNERGEVYRVAGVALDITDKRTLESQFRQAQKMEAVGRLAGGIAHDFNNLLTVIMSYADMLSPKGCQRPIPPRTISSRSEGGVTGGHADPPAAGVQPAAGDRAAAGRSSTMSCGTSAKMLQRLIGEDIELVTALARDLWRCMIDPSQLEQVIMNLAVNSATRCPGAASSRSKPRA